MQIVNILEALPHFWVRLLNPTQLAGGWRARGVNLWLTVELSCGSNETSSTVGSDLNHIVIKFSIRDAYQTAPRIIRAAGRVSTAEVF